MKIPKNALVAVADGEKLGLYNNSGDEHAPKLAALPYADVSTHNMGSGGRHQSSSANPSDSQQDEDSFAAGVAEVLNNRAMAGKIDHVIVIAAPRTLGELRKHYHKTLVAKMAGEIPKDLTGHAMADIEKVIAAA
jgi:protein required for attachment to host cells